MSNITHPSRIDFLKAFYGSNKKPINLPKRWHNATGYMDGLFSDREAMAELKAASKKIGKQDPIEVVPYVDESGRRVISFVIGDYLAVAFERHTDSDRIVLQTAVIGDGRIHLNSDASFPAQVTKAYSGIVNVHRDSELTEDQLAYRTPKTTAQSTAKKETTMSQNNATVASKLFNKKTAKYAAIGVGSVAVVAAAYYAAKAYQASGSSVASTGVSDAVAAAAAAAIGVKAR